MKKRGIVIISLVMSIAFASTAFAGGWKQDDKGWKYSPDDSSYATMTWENIDGKNYYFDSNGYWTEDYIQFVRDTYAYTNAHVNEYTTDLVYTFSGPAAPEEGVKGYSSGNWIVKEIIDDRSSGSGLYTEAYYLNPALGKTMSYGENQEGDYPEYRLVFTYSVDSDGKEYRVYYKDNQVVRYIGPDSKVVDISNGVDIINFYPDVIPAWQILCAAAPGFWVPYEGEGGDY